MRARVPHSAGDFTPAGGGMCLPSVLNNWPMKPSGVQLARPILPPERQTRSSSAAALSWFGVNITPKVETTTSKLAIGERQRLGVGLLEFDRQPSASARARAALEQRRHVVGRGDVAPAARGGERGVAVAGGDVEHGLAGTQVERLAKRLADDLQRGADDGVVAGRPGGLLAGLQRGEIGRRGWRGRGRGRCGQGGGVHGRLLSRLVSDRATLTRCRPEDFEAALSGP